MARYYIKRERSLNNGLLSVKFWDGKGWHNENAKGFTNRHNAIRCAERLCRRLIAFSNELVIAERHESRAALVEIQHPTRSKE